MLHITSASICKGLICINKLSIQGRCDMYNYNYDNNKNIYDGIKEGSNIEIKKMMGDKEEGAKRNTRNLNYLLFDETY